MNSLTDISPSDTIRYPFQICGIFKTPARPNPDTMTYVNED